SENTVKELNFDISREMSKGETDAVDGCGNKAMIYMKIFKPYVTRSIVFSFSLCSIWELRSQHEEECRHLKEECRHIEEQTFVWFSYLRGSIVDLGERFTAAAAEPYNSNLVHKGCAKQPHRSKMIECHSEPPVYAAIGGGYCRRDSPAIRVTSESVDFEAICVNRCVKHGE
nr:hypothetical protein [Tanacetum cinerariifolium]